MKSYRACAILFALAATLLVVLAFYLDASVQSWIAQNQHAGLNRFMQAVSRYGDWPTNVALGLLLCAIAYLRRSERWLRIFLAMLIACALAGLATRVIKMSAGRARPQVESALAWTGPTFSAKHHAFPSGHSSSSAAFFATLLFVSWRAGSALLPIPFLVGFSRIYIGAHHLSDVIFGALLGTLTAFAVAKLLLPRMMQEEATPSTVS